MSPKYMKHLYLYQMSQSEEYYPVYCYDLINTVMPEMITCNWHEDVEIVYLHQGDFNLYINESLYKIHPGDICVINSNYLHYGIPAGEGISEVFVLLFPLKHLLMNNSYNDPHLTALANNQLWFAPYIKPTDSIYEPLKDVLKRIYKVWIEHPAAYDLKIKSLLFELLFLFCSNETYLVQGSGWDDTKAKEKLLVLQSYLADHYSERFTIGELANHLCMSQESFYKFMKSIMGCSPLTFINRYRLNKAVELLDTTNLSVTEICFQCGFQNISYFIRTFKKQFGYTPKQMVKHKTK